MKTGGFAFFTKWSCGADNDARSYLTDPGTWQQTKDPVGPRPCFNYLSIADLLNQKGLRWRMYTFAPNYNINGLGVNRSIWVKQFQNYSYVTFTSSRLLDDLKEPNYKLAEVTWVLPSPFCSDHPMAGPAWCGPTWVASVVDALAKSHFWNDTAIFVTWDDWGGFYDPVPPYVVRDAFGPGPRIPLIVAGGYAKRHHVSHVNTEFGTLLAFIEETFWLPNLGGPAEDTSPYLNNFDDFFDFNSPPKAPTLVPYAKPVEFFRQREDLKLLEKYPGLRRFFMGDD